MKTKNSIKALIILLVISTRSIIVLAQTQVEYFQGSIGSYPIILTLAIDTTNNSLGGSSYFYEKSCKTINLHGQKIGNSLKFYRGFKDDKIEAFELSFSSPSSINGKWIKKNKTIPVRLQKINTDTIIIKPEIGKVLTDNEIEFTPDVIMQFNNMHLRRDSVQVIKGKSFVWFTETLSGIAMFRLGNGFSEKTRNLINPQLDAIQYYEAFSVLTCTSNTEYSLYSSTTSLIFFDKNLLSIELPYYWDCGGPHPDDGSKKYLFNLNNGKRLTFEDIISFHSSVTRDSNDENRKAYLEYRQKYAAPEIIKLLSKRYPQEFTNTQDSDECNYHNIDMWAYATWLYTNKGIEITPSVYRYDRPCQNQFLIPFEDLKPYINPKFKYALP